ncbi:peptidase inhibitor family I36 protein [Nonomuraea sp. NPDC049625]|uniref:peptidase inhibitor family I36 protein n=1 Tax=Nonomuraea sp. NPDC049625 TaxID=3155775 RepID=UPI00342CDD44
MRTLSRTLTTATVTMALGGTVLATAPPVAAAGRDGVCDSGEFCYYFNSGNQGSISDFTGSVADYGTKQPSCYDFKGPGNGQGQCVKNAAASAWNRTGTTVRVYYNSNHAGEYQDFPPGAKGNLNSILKNQNASHQFSPSTPARVDMSYALYQARGRLVVGFDGYKHISGRHEGIDFARGLGAQVHSLVSGKVINVVRGATGGRGLSTIAIYNAALDKTVIYLHTAPSSSLSQGQQVSRGQVIATESWRGVSSGSNAHTHVEMRLGQRTLAAKSVNDPRLENPNPTSFWTSQGYNIR